MKVLAIETSCDETAIAIIDAAKNGEIKVLSNIISSQIKIHRQFGGVVPNLARREHEKNLVPVLLNALKEAGMLKLRAPIAKRKNPQIEKILAREEILLKKLNQLISPLEKPAIDAIAVTFGPGLAPALWAGINFAKALASLWKLPLLPVNHMEGHVFSSFLESTGENVYRLRAIKFPAVALLVSGGHTKLQLVKKLGSYKKLGETLDDAAGECFDKTARILGLPYPGGPEISKAAERGNSKAIPFPRPMIKSGDLNFSFSGLKTSVLYYLRDKKLSGARLKKSVPDIAASFEAAAVETLVQKTLDAIKKTRARSVIIGGGVAANKKLREEFEKILKKQFPEINYFAPDLKHTGDNALMIALAAVYGSKKLKSPTEVRAEPGAEL